MTKAHTTRDREPTLSPRAGISGTDDTGLVGEHDPLDAIAARGLGKDVRHVRLDGGLAAIQASGISAFDSPAASNSRASRSRTLSQNLRVGGPLLRYVADAGVPGRG